MFLLAVDLQLITDKSLANFIKLAFKKMEAVLVCDTLSKTNMAASRERLLAVLNLLLLLPAALCLVKMLDYIFSRADLKFNTNIWKKKAAMTWRINDCCLFFFSFFLSQVNSDHDKWKEKKKGSDGYGWNTFDHSSTLD